MNKILETVFRVHQFILIVTLALFIVLISTQQPLSDYSEAKSELQNLDNAIIQISDQVKQDYETIYQKSELMASIHAWQKALRLQNQTINIEVITPNDLTVPDLDEHPLTTLETKVKWADQIYLNQDYSFFLCNTNRNQVVHALNKLFRKNYPDTINLKVYIYRASTFPSNDQLQCKIELQYTTKIGIFTGIKSTNLNIPTNVINITGLEPWIDLKLAGTLKENALGDYEDARSLVIPALRDIWPDVRNLPSSSIETALGQMGEKEKNDTNKRFIFFGQTFNKGLTIVLASVINFFLMLYLIARLNQINIALPKYKLVISESEFFGIMHSYLGRLIMLFSLFVFPLGVCSYAILKVLPFIHMEWSGPQWIVGPISRYTYTIVLFITSSVLIIHVFRIWERIAHSLKRVT